MITTITNFFTLKGFVGFIEFMVMVLMVLYTLFAFITLRQVRLMNKSFSTQLAPFFSTVALINFIISAVITLFTILAAQ